MSKEIRLPLTQKDIETLNCGDAVYLSGTIITGRDKAVKKLKEIIESKEQLPVKIKDETIFYVGPTFKDGKITSAGPTTSKRMDGIIEPLLNNGLKGIIGKGNVSKDVQSTMKKNGAIYFAAIGGAGALSAKCIKKVEIICFEEYGTEAVYKFELDKLPVIIAYDTKGNNIYE